MSLTEIVIKTFYIIIPYSPPAFGTKPGARPLGAAGISEIFEKLFGGKKNEKGEFKGIKFEEYKSQLEQRVEAVSQGLRELASEQCRSTRKN